MAATRNKAITPSLRVGDSFRLHNNGNGRVMITASARIFGTFDPMTKAERLKHLKSGIVLSHAAVTGWHWKIVVNRTAIPQARTKATMA
ncbi:hypothetical protein RRF57_006089 [Xylaria bambusicola]|uniref:Uncharacterized protein n=1 Tax=Xylaria bambusicola TaxID=326684 RepID=A0AAN7URY3_9PEZI